MLLGTKKTILNASGALFRRLIVQRFFVDHLVCKKQERSIHTTNAIPQIFFLFRERKIENLPFCSRYTWFG